MSNLYLRLRAEFPSDLTRVFAFLADGQVVTYAEVDAGSARFANALQGLGVKPGDRVAVQAEKVSPNYCSI
jgi:malonyl-CoA/methylmalonyl-CoA synthetase